MRIASKTLAYLLLGWALLAPLAGQLAPAASEPVPASGCHHHEQPRAPLPASYACCLTGHNVAVPQAPHVVNLAAVHTRLSERPILVSTNLPQELKDLLVPPGDPPKVFALRI